MGGGIERVFCGARLDSCGWMALLRGYCSIIEMRISSLQRPLSMRLEQSISMFV